MTAIRVHGDRASRLRFLQSDSGDPAANTRMRALLSCWPAEASWEATLAINGSRCAEAAAKAGAGLEAALTAPISETGPAAEATVPADVEMSVKAGKALHLTPTSCRASHGHGRLLATTWIHLVQLKRGENESIRRRSSKATGTGCTPRRTNCLVRQQWLTPLVGLLSV